MVSCVRGMLHPAGLRDGVSMLVELALKVRLRVHISRRGVSHDLPFCIETKYVTKTSTKWKRAAMAFRTHRMRAAGTPQMPDRAGSFIHFGTVFKAGGVVVSVSLINEFLVWLAAFFCTSAVLFGTSGASSELGGISPEAGGVASPGSPMEEDWKRMGRISPARMARRMALGERGTDFFCVLPSPSFSRFFFGIISLDFTCARARAHAQKITIWEKTLPFFFFSLWLCLVLVVVFVDGSEGGDSAHHAPSHARPLTRERRVVGVVRDVLAAPSR